ncbi:MAG TPA: Wzz/FepE/Etk N-terminal domain-containing protein [Candidatus Sulfotelmatobacter sp.]|nr:Wzz/FepE/Etk N-terminal domain-containing protein [Candidatus Sulfotelmatobacter sp.]
MSSTGVRQRQEPPDTPVLDPLLLDQEVAAARERQAERIRLLWEHRKWILKVMGVAFFVSTLVAFLIPNSYTSTAQLMPPDSQSSSALTMMSALLGKNGGGGFAGLTGDLLGLKSSGALFIGVLRSETSQDHIIQQFGLNKVYGTRLLADARKRLDQNTAISEDRKSGIITITVTDHNAQLAAAIANAYIDELNSLVAGLSTSSAHRERVFLEDRLKVAKTDLDEATNQLAQFSSKNNTLDLQTEGKAMLDAAATISGQLIVAESQLQGLRQIYTDNNPRVRSLEGRVNELRKQLEKFGGNSESSETTPVDHSIAASTQATDPPSDRTGSSPFPTLRNLPLLGAKYSDYYRRAKIQETVFELLTEQYELAKVQEAKETPSVKVLDPGKVPEQKSFPPRKLIALFGTSLAFALAAIWILAKKGWEEIDPSDPRKVLALEVAGTIRTKASWARNGDEPSQWPQRIWSRLRSKQDPDGPSAS